MPSPARLAHVVFRTSDLPALRDFYLTLLEGTVSFENRRICFLTYDEEHHRVAIISDRKLPERPAKTNFEHVAFAYQDLRALLGNHDRLLARGIKPSWTVNHGPTTSFYYNDPDGNGIELQVDNYDTAGELHAFFASPAFDANPIGIDVDAEDLRRLLAGGENERDLLLRADLR